MPINREKQELPQRTGQKGILQALLCWGVTLIMEKVLMSPQSRFKPEPPVARKLQISAPVLVFIV